MFDIKIAYKPLGTERVITRCVSIDVKPGYTKGHIVSCRITIVDEGGLVYNFFSHELEYIDICF